MPGDCFKHLAQDWRHTLHRWINTCLAILIVLPLSVLCLPASSARYPLPHLLSRYRELWVFLSAPSIGLLLLATLFSSTRQPASVQQPTPTAFSSFLRVHGELTAAALRAFFHHQRLRPFLLYTALDRAVCVHLWAPYLGGLAALVRSLLAGVVSVLMSWALELYFRRKFVLAGLYS